MIQFKQVGKTFTQDGQDVVALKDVNLSIAVGDIYGLVGYSGAGKSTLLRLINVLEQPSVGEVWVDGALISAYSPAQLRHAKRNIGMIFQHFNLLETKTVAQNIALPLVLAGVNKAEIDRKVDELLAYVELPDKKHAYPRELSGGQKQRVGIARALVNDPKILLCDEATSALDPQTTLAILNLLKKINREQNITIVLVTHEMSVVERVCNKVAVMEQGQVIEHGSVLAVFGQPQQEATRRFVRTIIKRDLPAAIGQHYTPSEHLRLFSLGYLGRPVSQPLLSPAVLQQDAAISVLFANTKEIDGMLVGSLSVSIAGTPAQIAAAVASIEAEGISVTEQEGAAHV